MPPRKLDSALWSLQSRLMHSRSSSKRGTRLWHGVHVTSKASRFSEGCQQLNAHALHDLHIRTGKSHRRWPSACLSLTLPLLMIFLLTTSRPPKSSRRHQESLSIHSTSDGTSLKPDAAVSLAEGLACIAKCDVPSALQSKTLGDL